MENSKLVRPGQFCTLFPEGGVVWKIPYFRERKLSLFYNMVYSISTTGVSGGEYWRRGVFLLQYFLIVFLQNDVL